MSQSREAILGAIRDSLRGGGGRRRAVSIPGEEGEASSRISRGYRRDRTRSRDDMLALFAARVAEYRATVIRCSSAELPGVILGRVLAREVARLVIPPDLPNAWTSGLPGRGVELLEDHPPGDLSKSQLSEAHGVLTGCALAIAETGTFVLNGGQSQGRRALSLLPDFHLCVVFAHQVVETVPDAFGLLGVGFRNDPLPLTLISGPSATSDIELIRVEGVHGPRTLDVVLVMDS
jgi:L-lactate dehydrogenase complex protein LldG